MLTNLVGLDELKVKKSLPGQYEVTGSNLIREGCHLVIGTRKPEPNKSKHYLLERIPGRKPPHRYISSLYPSKNAPGSPQEAQVFDFDYQGGYYSLKIDQGTGKAEISFQGQKARAEGGKVANP